MKFHQGGTLDWSLSESAVDAIRKILRPGMRTLETGSGRTTVMFAEAGCVHTAVTPSESEVDLIKTYCDSAGLSLAKVYFWVEPSQTALPKVDFDLDVVLIDGAHGYPLPQIDWFYASLHLKVGGVMILDDIQLWSVRTLCDFLSQDPAWEHIETADYKTAIFRLRKPFQYVEWRWQPYVYRKSAPLIWTRKLRLGLAHLMAGKFRQLAMSMVREVTGEKKRALVGEGKNKKPS